MTHPIRGAFSWLSPRLFFPLWVGNFVLMLLAAAWLQIPDSHTWQFAFSMLSAVLLVLGFLSLYTLTFRLLRPCVDRPPLWVSWLLLIGFVLLWWLVLQAVAAGRAHEARFAGYWNSQSPVWLRYHLGYSRLVAWQEHLYDAVQCLWAGLLLPLAVETCACGWKIARFGRSLRVYRHWSYWLVVLVCGLGGSDLTWALAEWTPDAGLAGQTVSVIARLGVAYTIDILLLCFLLALIAECLERPAATNKGRSPQRD